MSARIINYQITLTNTTNTLMSQFMTKVVEDAAEDTINLFKHSCPICC